MNNLTMNAALVACLLATAASDQAQQTASPAADKPLVCVWDILGKSGDAHNLLKKARCGVNPAEAECTRPTEVD